MTKCDWCGHEAPPDEMTDVFGLTRCKDVRACAERNGVDIDDRPRYRLAYTLERVEEERHAAQ